MTTLSASGAVWRALAYAGARYGPRPWLEYSPPAFGLLFAALMPGARRRVRANLRRVLGPRSALLESADVARTFASYAGCLAEALASERPEARGARRRIRGGADLGSLADGAVVVTAHVGAWDAAAPLLAADYGVKVMIAMAREADAGARRVHDGVRERAGVRVAHVGDHQLDALPLLRHLREGGVVAAQLDRSSPGARTLSVQLFGAPFEVPEGPFALAGLAQVPVVPLFVRRVGHFDYELWGGQPIRVPKRPSADVLAKAAERAVWELERFVYAHPTQWFHFSGQ